MAKTNKKHFELFKSECRKWIDRLELSGCDIRFEEEKDEDLRGFCDRNYLIPHRVIVIYYCGEKKGYSDVEWTEIVKDTAKHEVIHALLSKLAVLAHERYTTKDNLIEAEEELVRKLEKIIK